MTPIPPNADLKLSKLLASVSICVGVAQLLAPDRVERQLRLGLPSAVTRAFGVKNLLTGAVVAAHPDGAAPIGLRLANDALDLAVLGQTLLPGRKVTGHAMLATLGVLALTALDLAAGASLRRRRARVLETARRTRYRGG